MCLLHPMQWLSPLLFRRAGAGEGGFSLVPGVGSLPRGWFGTSSCATARTSRLALVLPRFDTAVPGRGAGIRVVGAAGYGEVP